MKAPALCLLSLILTLFLHGCGKDEQRSAASLGSGDLRWANFPVEIRLDSSLAAESSGGVPADVQAAIDFWESKAGKRLFTLGDSWDNAQPPYTGSPASPDALLGNVIFLSNPWPFDDAVAGKTIIHSSDGRIENAVILLNSEKHLCSDCSGMMSNEISRRKLVAHELGHFLGFSHAEANTDIMYPEILSGDSLSSVSVDETLLRKLTE